MKKTAAPPRRPGRVIKKTTTHPSSPKPTNSSATEEPLSPSTATPIPERHQAQHPSTNSPQEAATRAAHPNPNPNPNRATDARHPSKVSPRRSSPLHQKQMASSPPSNRNQKKRNPSASPRSRPKELSSAPRSSKKQPLQAGATSPTNNNAGALYYEEDDTIETEDADEMEPLTTDKKRYDFQARSPLEIEITTNGRKKRRRPRRQKHNRNDPPWYKLMTSLVVFCVVLTPILALIGLYQEQSHEEAQKHSKDVVWIPTCDEQDFHQTFDDFMVQVDQQDDSERCELAIQRAFRPKQSHTSELDMDSDCTTCPNPLIPQPSSLPGWNQMFQDEKDQVVKRIDELIYGKTVDVCFLGDSILHRWPSKSFQELFNKDKGATVEGMALAIDAERTRNLLFRIRNAVFVSTAAFRPKVFWLLIGTNDLGLDHCSVETVVAGIIAIVEDLLQLYPDATIVINGILPRRNTGVGGLLNTYADFVNDRVACFATMREGVEYFDASTFFQEDNKVSDTDSDSSDNVVFQKDGVHPTKSAYYPWGQAVATRVRAILDDL